MEDVGDAECKMMLLADAVEIGGILRRNTEQLEAFEEEIQMILH